MATFSLHSNVDTNSTGLAAKQLWYLASRFTRGSMVQCASASCSAQTYPQYRCVREREAHSSRLVSGWPSLWAQGALRLANASQLELHITMSLHTPRPRPHLRSNWACLRRVSRHQPMIERVYVSNLPSRETTLSEKYSNITMVALECLGSKYVLYRNILKSHAHFSKSCDLLPVLWLPKRKLLNVVVRTVRYCNIECIINVLYFEPK